MKYVAIAIVACFCSIIATEAIQIMVFAMPQSLPPT